MKGIKSIHAKNFEGYEEMHVDLSEGVNYIYGDTDSGKSSIVRMIRWCLQNQSSGFRFARKGIKGKDIVSVKIVFFDGVSIERRRNANTVNEYILNGDKKNTFKSLKQIPEKVKEAIALSDVSIQMQKEQFFLVDLPPKQMAKKINEVVDLEIMDKLTEKVSGVIRETRKEKELLSLRTEKLDKKINELEWIEDAAEDLNIVFEIEKQRFDVAKIVDRATYFLSQINGCLEDIKVFEEITTLKKDVLAFKKQINLIDQEEEDLQFLQEHAHDIKQLRQKIKRNQYISKTKTAVKELITLAREVSSVEDDVVWLSKKGDEVSSLKQTIEVLEKEIKIKKEKHAQLLKDLGVCPTCGSKVCSHE